MLRRLALAAALGAAAGCTEKELDQAREKARELLATARENLVRYVPAAKRYLPAAGPASPTEALEEADFETVVHSEADGLFACEVPDGWLATRDTATETRNVGWMLRAARPGRSGGMALYMLSVYFYPGGHFQFPSADDYVEKNTLPLPERTLSPVKPVPLPAGKARRWTLTLPIPGFPDQTTEMRAKDSYAVLEGAGGFFVLNYAAPEDMHARHVDKFERMLKTFKPSLNPPRSGGS